MDRSSFRVKYNKQAPYMFHKSPVALGELRLHVTEVPEPCAAAFIAQVALGLVAHGCCGLDFAVGDKHESSRWFSEKRETRNRVHCE